MTKTATLVLDHLQIEQKINRMAYQIYENHYDEKEIVIAGIANRGLQLAKLLMASLEKIAPFKVTLTEVVIQKRDPISDPPALPMTEAELEDKAVIVVDDVLNSGRTLLYGVYPFLTVRVKKIATAVLVNRSHRHYPIKANYVGLSLATTMHEHIQVDLKSKKHGVYLS